MGKQLYQVFLGGFVEVRHGGYNGVEVKARIDVMVAAGGLRRLYDSHVFGGLVLAAEQIILPS